MKASATGFRLVTPDALAIACDVSTRRARRHLQARFPHRAFRSTPLFIGATMRASEGRGSALRLALLRVLALLDRARET